MKKYALMALISTISFQTFASDYYCFDKTTGADRGKIEVTKRLPDSGAILTYSNLSSSTDGWVLRLTKNGNLYNADNMVKNGHDFLVGQVKVVATGLEVQIQSLHMSCSNGSEL